jgi:hypothetical protein
MRRPKYFFASGIFLKQVERLTNFESILNLDLSTFLSSNKRSLFNRRLYPDSIDRLKYSPFRKKI